MPMEKFVDFPRHRRTPAFEDLLQACNRQSTASQPPRLQLKRSPSAPQQQRLNNSAPSSSRGSLQQKRAVPRKVSPLDLIHATARDLPGLGPGWWTERKIPPSSRPMTARPPDNPRVSNRPMTARPSLGRQQHQPLSPDSSSAMEIPINESDRESVESPPSILGFSKESEGNVSLPNMESVYKGLIPLFEMGMQLDIDTVLNQTRQSMRTLLQCQGTAVYIFDADGGGLRRNSSIAPLLENTSGIVNMVLGGKEELCNFLKGQSNEAADHEMRIEAGGYLDSASAVLASVVYAPEGAKVGAVVAAGKIGGNESFGSNDEGLIRLISMQLGMLIALCRQASERLVENKRAARNSRYFRALNTCVSLSEVTEVAKEFARNESGAELCDVFPLIGSESQNEKAHRIPSVHRVLSSGQLFVVDDLHADPQTRHMSGGLNNARSLMCFPIRSGKSGKVVGAVQALHSKPFAFSKRQAQKLESVMDQTSFALEREYMNQLTLNLQASLPKVFESMKITTTVLAAERVTKNFLGAVCACIFVVNKARGTVWIVNSQSEAEQELDKVMTATSLVGDCLAKNEVRNYTDVRNEPRFVSRIDAAKCEHFARNHLPMLFVPVRAPRNESDVIAVLAVAAIPGQTFSALSQSLAPILAVSVSTAFENCMRHEISELAIKDGRTMLKIAAEIHHNDQFKDLARIVIDGASSCLNASVVRVYLRDDPDTRKIRVFADLDGNLVDEVIWDHGDALINKSLLKGLLVNVDSELVLEEMEYQRLHRASLMEGKGSGKMETGPAMCCPLFTGVDHGKVIGAVFVERHTSSAVFTLSEETKFKYLCQQASPAFKRAMDTIDQQATLGEMEGLMTQYRTLCRTLPTLSGQKNEESINSSVIHAAKTVIPSGYATLFRLQDAHEGQSFVVTTKIGSQVSSQLYDTARGFAGQVFRRNAPMVSNHLHAEDYFDDELDSIPNNGGPYRNAIGIPIHGHNSEREKVLAVLVLYNKLPAAAGGLGSGDYNEEEMKMLQVLGDCASVFVTFTIENLEFMRSLSQLLRGDLEWDQMDIACETMTNCKRFAVLEATNDENWMTCVYPAGAAGQQISVEHGLLGEVKNYKRAVRVLDSKTDRRVSPENDAFRFLGHVQRDKPARRSSLTIVPFASAVPTREKTGKQIEEDPKVGWSSALCVPVVLQDDGPVRAIAVLVSEQDGAFDTKDIDMVDLLMKLAWQRHVSDRTETQRRMEAASRHALMTSIIALSSIRTTDTSILAKQAISGVRKLLNVQYCAVYVENARTSKLPQSEYSETCQRWDSLDIATTVKRSAGIPGKVFKQRSPVMMDHVSDLDAGVLPQQQMGKRRSLLAVPVIGAAEGKVRAVLLAAWKKDETAFNDQDETNLSDLAAVLAESLKNAENNAETERTITVMRTASANAPKEDDSLSPRSFRTGSVGGSNDRSAMTPRQRRASIVMMKQRLEQSPLESPLESPAQSPRQSPH